VHISPATEFEKPKIKAFFNKVGVSEKVLSNSDSHLLTVKDQEWELAAVLGVLHKEETSILHHLIIDSKRCDLAIVLEILQNAVAFAASQKAKRILFLSPAPAELFGPLGFTEIEREGLDDEVQQALPETDTLPPSTKLLAKQL
jgi:N-acetylglutamate synthase-like GNAT family acetyltransferase